MFSPHVGEIGGSPGNENEHGHGTGIQKADFHANALEVQLSTKLLERHPQSSYRSEINKRWTH